MAERYFDFALSFTLDGETIEIVRINGTIEQVNKLGKIFDLAGLNEKHDIQIVPASGQDWPGWEN